MSETDDNNNESKDEVEAVIPTEAADEAADEAANNADSQTAEAAADGTDTDADAEQSNEQAATDTDSGEPVLSDDEKNALLDGVASGAVEVTSAHGPRFAAVSPFVFSERARIERNRMPRLESLNQMLAKQVTDSCSRLVQDDLIITPTAIRRQTFGDFGESWPRQTVVMPFSVAPLTGKAMVVVDSSIIGPLVELFFGGGGQQSDLNSEATHSRGALSIVKLITTEIVASLQDVWTPLKKLSPEPDALQVGLEMTDALVSSDPLVVSEFEITLGEAGTDRGSFCILWAETTIAPLRAALEGQSRPRDAAADAHWKKVLQKRLPEVVVGLSSTVGNVRMPLSHIATLKPGDVIGIEAPRVATVRAHGVPLIEGRFGVHAGRNAIEAVGWLSPEI